MNYELLAEIINDLCREKQIEDTAIEFAIDVVQRYLKESIPVQPKTEGKTDNGITQREVSELVNDVQNGTVEFEIAKQHLALFGWVLHDGYPVIAQAVKNRMCASCKHWNDPCFHMGVVDGTCAITDDSSGDEDTCEHWQSAIEGDQL